MPTRDGGFQLGLLPEKKWDWRTFAASYGMVTGLIVLMIVVSIMTSDTLITASYRVIELIPRPSLRPQRLPKPRPQHAKLLPAAPVFQTPKLTVPKEVRAPKPQPQEIEPPKVAMNTFAPAILKATSGARPVLIHTGEFQGSSVAPTVNAPIAKVQTGGFGDPNGLKPSENSKPNGKLMAAAAGSFDMPVGPGQGNGSGGAKGIKGTVASADFGSGVATAGQGDGRRSGRGSAGVQSSGFGSQEIAQNTPHIQRVDSGPPTTLVEITYKPNPVYTDEARHLQLQGEVLLEVEFAANGQLHVNRVVRGLGHGLDEAAVAAANKMRFKPALRNGQPVDSTAIVHVVFQLAY
ncbi:MAG TPA: energy transducer TonB [Terriglobales bacterium]|jgi:TonB family protein|nr:energy transducer TonB [Terriglobales bacterium]